MKAIWTMLIYKPLYNGLFGLITLFGGNLAASVVVLTVVVKVILSPLSYKSIKSQVQQKKLQPFINKIKEEYPEKQEQSKKMLELYKEHKTNPFTGCLLLIIQLPIILALYRVFYQGLDLRPELLYQGINFHQNINTMFLGFIDLTEKSILLALLAGLTQFIHMWYMGKRIQNDTNEGVEKKQAEQITEMMQKNMKYSMPIMVGVFAFIVPSAVALYWVVNNLFSLGQEWLVQKKELV